MYFFSVLSVINNTTMCMLYNDTNRLIICLFPANDCAKGVCQNDAISCTQRLGSYECECKAGYTGVNCETG